MKRFSLITIGIILILLAGGCMTNVVRPTHSRQPAAALPAPQPLPTPDAAGRPLHFSIDLPQQPLHGRPAFTAALSAELSPDLSRQLDRCQQIIWDFGDGRRISQACPPAGDARAPIAAAGQYDRPGLYFVHIQLEMDNGEIVQSTRPQTVIVAEAQPVSFAGRLLYWLAWLGAMGLAIAAASWLTRRPRRQKIWGGLLLGLLLAAYLPPFSYLPDPLGFYWGMWGGYRYDPRLPFANRFVAAGDPTETLRPYLDGLIGQTGLDPLDPVHPLSGYQFIRVYSGGDSRVTAVAARLTYADGGRRVYNIPVYQPRPFSRFYQRNWQYDGLGRLRAEHKAMPGIPFAGEDPPLSPPRPIPNSAGQTASGAVYGPWLWRDAPSPPAPLLWSPQGDSFLVKRWDQQKDRTARQSASLWRIALDGHPPQQIAQNVINYGWSADGQSVLYTRIGTANNITRFSLASGETTLLPNLFLPHTEVWPDIRPDGIWFVADGALWRHDGERGMAESIPLPESAITPQPAANRHFARFNPAGDRIAYSCNQRLGDGRLIRDLCLQDRDGRHWTKIPLAAADMALSWRADGERLAIVEWARAETVIEALTIGDAWYPYGRTLFPSPDAPVRLTIVDSDGTVRQTIPIAESGAVHPPQWLPDGRHLLLQLYIWGGRRILRIDSHSGQITDLSQPRWDAEFSLHPDGRRLLLGNGRGLFWLSDIDAPLTLSP